jgi:hypothetical protein
VDRNKAGVSIDMAIFPGTLASQYWSSSVQGDLGDVASVINFVYGGVGGSTKQFSNSMVRCVATGP